MLRSRFLSRSIQQVFNRNYGSQVKHTPESVLEEIKREGHTKIKLSAVDIDGVLRGKYISLEKFESAVKSGLGFCSVIYGWDLHDKTYKNCTFTGPHNGFPDILGSIDVSSYRKLPWEKNTPFFLVDFIDDKSVYVCPRKLLKKVIAQCENETGGIIKAGPELEFFNFAETNESLHEKGYKGIKPFTPGMFGYSILRTGQHSELYHSLYDECTSFGVHIEGLHTETGPGVFETAIQYTDALDAADQVVLFKYAAKIVGSRFNMFPCFMAKPYSNMPGCSGHLHQSINDIKTGKNLFYDEKDQYKMSQLFKHYVAGQLNLLPKILPMLCPTVNSYKRLVQGFWAPVEATWGVENRIASLRVIPGTAKSTRLETRIPGADSNPYLSIAASVAAGLYGIRHKMELPAEVVGETQINPERTLANNLLDATKRMRDSPEANEMFGEDFVQHFTETRESEYNEYLTSFQGQITQWELQRYAEII